MMHSPTPASAAVHSANADKSHQSMTPMERDVSESEKSDFSDALAVGRELDLNLPDSHAVRDDGETQTDIARSYNVSHVTIGRLQGPFSDCASAVAA